MKNYKYVTYIALNVLQYVKCIEINLNTKEIIEINQNISTTDKGYVYIVRNGTDSSIYPQLYDFRERSVKFKALFLDRRDKKLPAKIYSNGYIQLYY